MNIMKHPSSILCILLCIMIILSSILYIFPFIISSFGLQTQHAVPMSSAVRLVISVSPSHSTVMGRLTAKMELMSEVVPSLSSLSHHHEM